MKKEFKVLISSQIEWKVLKPPIRAEYTLYWSRLSDLDNRGAVVTKYLQDALVEYWVIEDDNFNFIVENNYKVWGKDRDNPRFEVLLIEI